MLKYTSGNKPKLTLIIKMYNLLAASSATAIRMQQIVHVIFKSEYGFNPVISNKFGIDEVYFHFHFDWMILLLFIATLNIGILVAFFNH